MRRSGRPARSDRFRAQRASGISGAWSSSIQQASWSCQQTAAGSAARRRRASLRAARPPGRSRRSGRCSAWLASMSDQPGLDVGSGLPSRASVCSKWSRAWRISPSCTCASASRRCQWARSGAGTSRRRSAAPSAACASRNQPRRRYSWHSRVRWRSSSAGSPCSTSQSVADRRFSTSASSSAPPRGRLARVGEQAGEPGGVAPPHLGLLGRVGGQPLPGVLAQQLVHAVAPVLAHLDQRVVDQAGQQRQAGAGHGGGRVQVEAAPQHREAAQGLALAVAEQLPGPVDHRSDAAVARLHVGRGRLQQLAAGGQAVGDGRRGGGADPAGGQLDGQRHPGHQPADPPDGGQVGGRPEPGPQQPGPVLEQLDGRVAGRLRVRPGRRVGQAGHLDQPLGPEPQPPPRGPEDLHPGRPAEQLGQHPGGVAELLQVVQDQQQLAPGQGVGEHLPRVAGHGQGDAEGGGQVGHHQVGGLLRPRRAGADERHRHHPVAMPVPPGRARLQRQPGLADPSRPHQRHQPARRVVEQRMQPGQVLLPPDQRRERPRRPRRRARFPGSSTGGRSVNPPLWAIWSRRATVAGDGSWPSSSRRR